MTLHQSNPSHLVLASRVDNRWCRLPRQEQPTKADFSSETGRRGSPKSARAVVGIWPDRKQAGKNVRRSTGRTHGKRDILRRSRRQDRAALRPSAMPKVSRIAFQAYGFTTAYTVRQVRARIFRVAKITMTFFRYCRAHRSRCPAILFNRKPNGDYLTLRANCLENNLVSLEILEKGKERLPSVSWVPECAGGPASNGMILKARLTSTKVEGYLRWKTYLETPLPRPPPVSAGSVLWSKADSSHATSSYYR